MRSMLVLALGLSFACASMQPSAGAQAESCASATANRGTIVYSGPDSSSKPVATLGDRAQVCADAASVGFGYRHVKLSDGREGYVADGDLI